MNWTLDDLDAAVREFPTLRVSGPSSVLGVLPVCGALLGQDIVFNPTEESLADPTVQATCLVDSFEVEIGSDASGPSLRVLGPRLSETAERCGMNLIDLHVYADQSVCYSAPQQIVAESTSGITTTDFIWRYALPFLYEQAFFERHGRWPWGELAHGSLGLVEWLGRRRNPTNNDVRRTILCLVSIGSSARRLIQTRARFHHRCPCGSGNRLGECHPDLKPGIDLVRSWIAQGRSPLLRGLLLAR